MKKIKYRNNSNNYNNQVYSINYKFDSISPAGKCSGTALDLIKRYNELAKEAQGNGNYVEAEVFRQYAEHYRKIVTEINERKNTRFPVKENAMISVSKDDNAEASSQAETSTEVQSEQSGEENSSADNQENPVAEQRLVETKAKAPKKAFTVIEITNNEMKPKRAYHKKTKDAESATVSA